MWKTYLGGPEFRYDYVKNGEKEGWMYQIHVQKPPETL